MNLSLATDLVGALSIAIGYCQISSVVAAVVTATTITRLARNDQKAASALSLDLAGKVMVLDCGIEDLLEVVEG